MNIQRLKALLALITPDAWSFHSEFNVCDKGHAVIYDATDMRILTVHQIPEDTWLASDNAEFIALSHELMPLLLEAVTALEVSQSYLLKLSDTHGDKGASSAWAGNESLLGRLSRNNETDLTVITSNQLEIQQASSTETSKELTHKSALSSLGYIVIEDPDFRGKWVWVSTQDGCSNSFDTEDESVNDAWFNVSGRTMGALNLSSEDWNALSLVQQFEQAKEVFFCEDGDID